MIAVTSIVYPSPFMWPLLRWRRCFSRSPGDISLLILTHFSITSEAVGSVASGDSPTIERMSGQRNSKFVYRCATVVRTRPSVKSYLPLASKISFSKSVPTAPMSTLKAASPSGGSASEEPF